MLRRKLQMEGRNWFSAEEAVWQSLIKSMFCVVFNWSNSETNKAPKIVVHNGGKKHMKLTVKCQEKLLSVLFLHVGGAKSDNAYVCSDPFV